MSIRYRQTLVDSQEGFTCDGCSQEFDCDALTLSFGYGSKLDCTPDVHFHSDECLETFFNQDRPLDKLLKMFYDKESHLTQYTTRRILK